MDDMISLRRSAASVIMCNDQGDVTALRDMIKHHHIKTIRLKRDPQEAAWYQWFHQDVAR